MAYYADTTKKLLDQIGNPYVSETKAVNPAFDLSSLIMALAFMPKGSQVLTNTPLPPSKGLPGGMTPEEAMPKMIPMEDPSIFPTIFDEVGAQPAAAAAGAAAGGMARVPFSLAPQKPSILGDPQQVLAFLKMLGILG